MTEVRENSTVMEDTLAGSWRVDVNGWVFVRLQGAPYQVGFQNGYRLAHELEDIVEAEKLYVKGAYKRDWQFFRETAMRLYWPKMPEEYRSEIEGMANGVKAHGINSITLEDILAMNGFDDTVSYHNSLKAKEGQPLAPTIREEHCSAFIATGEMTHDGKLLVAHNTWSSYPIALCNVIVDMVPRKGNRFVMQTNAGSLSSESDWFLNKSGLVVTETTISGINTFNPDGVPYFIRSRKAIQYAETIDQWARTMIEDNNGGYANDWLVGDVKTDEIAWLEQGTFNHAFDRTSNGVFVGSNMATSELVRSETKFKYGNKSGSCTARDQRWKELIESNRGRLNADIAKKFLADHHDTFSGEDSPNRNTLCGHVDLDARGEPEWEVGPYYPTGAHDGKVTDSALAKTGAFWAHWGKPCDMDFSAASFLSQHPEYSWQASRLKDIKAYPWTLFNSSSEWQVS